MTLTGIKDSSGTYPVYGYQVASPSANIATVTASSISTMTQVAGDVVTAFAEKFEAVLAAPQNVKDEKRERAKDALVVEAEICRP
jgi:hypothetical protein